MGDQGGGGLENHFWALSQWWGGKTAASARNTGDGFISPAVAMTTAPVDGIEDCC